MRLVCGALILLSVIYQSSSNAQSITLLDNDPGLTGQFVLKTSKNDTVGVLLQAREAGIIFYKAEENIKDELFFKIIAYTQSSEYVYMIVSDSSMQFRLLFPDNNMISAAVGKAAHRIVCPGEAGFFRISAGRGKIYLCLICSKDELKIQDFIDTLAGYGGALSLRLKSACNGKLLEGRKVWVDKYHINNKGVSSAEHSILINVIEFN